MTKNIRITACDLNLNMQLSKSAFLNIIIFLYFVIIFCNLARLCIKYFPIRKVNQRNTTKANIKKKKKVFKRTLSSSIHFFHSLSAFRSHKKLGSNILKCICKQAHEKSEYLWFICPKSPKQSKTYDLWKQQKPNLQC